MAELNPDRSAFGAAYYALSCGRPYRRDDEWLAFFGGIASRIVSDIGPRTALDAGCALGLLVETLRDRGVDATGIDISSYAIANAAAHVRPHLSEGSIATELPRRYDLIVSIEVLEHMPAPEAEAAIANFSRHADDVLFSSSPLDFGEATHVNVRPPEYWAAEFARHGLFRDVDFDASFITPWAVRFRRRTEPLHRLVGDYERKFAPLARESAEVRKQLMSVQDELQQARQTAAELAAARDTIHHMERSLFWRARMWWQRVKGTFVPLR
jgi:hypothetical protein